MYIERCKHGLERGLCKPTLETMHGGTCLLYISYAAQYKSRGYDDTTNKYGMNIRQMSDITLTFLRVTKPEKLLAYLLDHGYSISQQFSGVYYISGIAELKIQIVVGCELEGDEFIPLRVQKENASEEDIRKFIEMCGGLTEQADKDMAENVMQVSIAKTFSYFVNPTYTNVKTWCYFFCRLPTLQCLQYSFS